MTTRPAAQETSKVGDWVKWAVGFAYGAILLVGGYVVTVEHRLTTTENTQSAHQVAATKAEGEIRGQIAQQANDSQKILTAITSVQVEVAKINGYLESRKTPNN